MKRFIIGLFSLIIMGHTGVLLSQQKNASLSFEKIQHDFGKIEESDGPVTCTFEFTNTGSIPLIINRVVASCGCTSPDWSKEPIVPGGKGFVKATYNPRNRPGKFNKSVNVYSNAEQPVVVLRIMGDVNPRPRTIEDDYPYIIGGMRFKSNHLAFVKVKQGQQKTILMEMVNVSDQPLSVAFDRVPDHLTLKTIPERIQPKEKGVIEATYDAGKKNDWGFVIDRVNVLLNQETFKNNLLTISATIEEDFAGLSAEEIKQAPAIQFDTKTFDFGKIAQKSSVTHEFQFTNTGKSDLILRKITSSCGCTAVSPKEKVIAPGQSSSIKATFSAGTRQGKQSKTITIITNDPRNSTVVLRVTGEVEVTSSNN